MNQILVFAGLFLIGVLSVLRVGNHPGLYADAVMPDYFGVQLLNPSTINTMDTIPHLGIPLLGQVYHGTATMFFSMIATIITGTTSIVQLRIVNCIYGSVACFVIYKILKSLDVNQIISIGIPFALAASPNLTSMYRTQYYVVLVGVVCILAAILFVIKWSKNISGPRSILAAGIFSGLAFYNYFNFLFCIPGIIVVLLCYSKKREESLSYNLLMYICGCALGELPGILGYFMVCLAPIQGITLGIKRVILVLYCVAYIFALVSSIIFLKQKSTRKYAYGILGSTAIGLGLIAFRTAAVLSEYIKNLNLAGQDLDLAGRISYLLVYIKQALCHSCEEYLVLNSNVCIGLSAIAVITAVLTVAAIAVGVLGKRKNTGLLLAVSGIFILYPLCTIFMVTRMQGQHFVILVFLMYLLLGISLDIIIVNGNHQAGIGFKNEKIALAFVFIMMVGIGEMNQTRIKLKFDDDLDSMNMRYSDSIRIVSEEALSAAQKGIGEFYVFPEWGYKYGFVYLTRNTIPCKTYFDAQCLRDFYDKGYVIKVCYFEDDDGEPLQYIDELSNILGIETVMERRTIQCWGQDATMIVVSP